ncbi:MAG: hypothetical protein M3N57_08295 [Actinomycetota bacterium]|nr:hypothetical protein [Actinomycetota bacterium]
MFSRRPALPEDLHGAWWAFVDCAEVIEGGRRRLLATLPAGRVDPAPVDVGLDAVAAAISDARAWMPRWRGVPGLGDEWDSCSAALDEAEAALPGAREVAASTGELEDLLGEVQGVIESLDAFADAERAWRRRWRPPAERDTATGSAT